MIFSPLFRHIQNIWPLSNSYMCLVLDVSKCTWTHVSSVVLLLLSVVLGTAWDYLSCLPFIWIQQKRKTQVLNLKFSLLWSPQATSYVELLNNISLCKEHGSVRFLNLKTCDNHIVSFGERITLLILSYISNLLATY